MKRKGEPEILSMCPKEEESIYTKIKKFFSLGRIYAILLTIMFILLHIYSFTGSSQGTNLSSQSVHRIEAMFNAAKEIHKLISAGAITLLAIFGPLGFDQLQSNYRDVVTNRVFEYLTWPFMALFGYISLLYLLLPLDTSGISTGNISMLLFFEYFLSLVFLVYLIKALLDFASMSLLEALRSNDISKNIKKHLGKGHFDNVLTEIRLGFQALKQSIEYEKDRDIVYNISCVLAHALLSSNSEGLWRNIWKHQTDYLFVDNVHFNIQLYYPPWKSLDEIKLSLLWGEYPQRYILIPLGKMPLRDIKYKVASELFPVLRAISIVSAQNHFYFFKSYSLFISNLENIKDVSGNSHIINLVLKENILESLDSLLSISDQIKQEIMDLYNQGNQNIPVSSLEELFEVYPTSLHILISKGLKLCKEDEDDIRYRLAVLKYISNTLRRYPQILLRFQEWELLKELYIHDTDIYRITSKFIEYTLQRIKEGSDSKFIETGNFLDYHLERAMIELFNILEEQEFEIVLEDNTIRFKNERWKIDELFYLETEDQKRFFKYILNSISN